MGLRAWLHRMTAPNSMGVVKVGDIGETKLVCIINQSLNMGKGKLAAQVGHASVSASMKLLSKDPEIFELWTAQGQRKVVLKSQSIDEIKEILKKAESAGLNIIKIHDAGRTQIPAGSLTVGAIGPAGEAELDELTGHLKLL